MPFDSPEAAELNKKLFATIYHGAVTASVAIAKKRQELVEEYEAADTTEERRVEIEKHLHRTDGEIAMTTYRGAYETFDGCPASQGQLQYDLWGAQPDAMWDWEKLKEDIKKYGMRNSLLLAPMPTASTSQILGNVECFEPITSNFFQRRTLAGEFTIINKYLVRDLIARGLWSPLIKNQILANGGSVQNIDTIPQDIKDLYKTAWEIKQKVLIDQAADRGVYVCQSQSLNLFVEDAEFPKLTNMHFYAWKRGLKTGIYYLRTRPKAKTMAFTLDPTAHKNKSPQKPVMTAASAEIEGECLMCSA
jgi:ribonucleotide reductase alpha subunit